MENRSHKLDFSIVSLSIQNKLFDRFLRLARISRRTQYDIANIEESEHAKKFEDSEAEVLESSN